MKRIDKIIYGSGRLGSSILLQLVGFLVFYMYFEIFNLDPFLNGVANAIAMLVIAFSGFISGYWSDKTKSRWGRRKPYILIGAPILAFTFIMTFIPHIFNLNISKIFGLTIKGEDLALFIYLLIFRSGFNFFYGFLLTPYQSWMPELSEEDERIEVSTYLNLFNIIAGAITVVLTFTFPVAFTGKGMGLITYVAVIFGIVEVGGFILPFIRLQEDPERFVAQPEIKTELRVVWENKNYMWWMLAQGLFSIAFTIVINSVLGFVQNILQFSQIEYYIVAGLLLLVIMAFWKMWSILSNRKSKHWALSTSLLLVTICFPLSVLGIFYFKAFGFIYVALIAAGISSWYLFPYVIIADMAEDDELRTREKRAGMYNGFNSIPLNIFQAIAMLVSGIVFSVFPSFYPRLTEGNLQTLFVINWMNTYPWTQAGITLSYLLGNFSFDVPNPVSSGYLWFGPVCSIFLALGLLVFTKVKIDFDLKERSKP